MSEAAIIALTAELIGGLTGLRPPLEAETFPPEYRPYLRRFIDGVKQVLYESSKMTSEDESLLDFIRYAIRDADKRDQYLVSVEREKLRRVLTLARKPDLAAINLDDDYDSGPRGAYNAGFAADTTKQWRSCKTAPKDGTWILGINNRGNQAVIIWKENALWRDKRIAPGWIHPFSDGYISSFWNGYCGSVLTHWMPLPNPPVRYGSSQNGPAHTSLK